jgi:recombination protein RecR
MLNTLDIIILIAYLKKLPGVGSKTAERFTFELLKWNEAEIKSFANILSNIKDNLKTCEICGCLKDNTTCLFCDSKRDENVMCVIASPKDAYSIEETNSYKGLYHVINHLISPMDGYNIDERVITKIEKRINKNNIKELVIALDSTLEGDATALFLKNRFKKFNLSISRLAFGIPVGSSLEYIDGGTLAKAFIGRQNF